MFKVGDVLILKKTMDCLIYAIESGEEVTITDFDGAWYTIEHKDGRELNSIEFLDGYAIKKEN